MRSAGGVAVKAEPLVLSRTSGAFWRTGPSAEHARAWHAGAVVLASAEGGSNLAVAARLGVNRSTVTKWRARFLAARLAG